VTDAVEALACALYLSHKCLRTVLDWIHDIKLVPIKKASSMINKFKYGVDYTLRQYQPLDDFKFCTDDTVKDLFVKYSDPDIPQLLFERIDLEPKNIG
jgi:ribosome biogenesis protein Tsr3